MLAEKNPPTPLIAPSSIYKTSLQNDCASVTLKNVQNAKHQSWIMMYSYEYVLIVKWYNHVVGCMLLVFTNLFIIPGGGDLTLGASLWWHNNTMCMQLYTVEVLYIVLRERLVCFYVASLSPGVLWAVGLGEACMFYVVSLLVFWEEYTQLRKTTSKPLNTLSSFHPWSPYFDSIIRLTSNLNPHPTFIDPFYIQIRCICAAILWA